MLCDDWGGFWYSADLNLSRLHDWVGRPDLVQEVADRVRARIGELKKEHLAGAPKSRRWRLRAKIGTRKRWYETVEEVS